MEIIGIIAEYNPFHNGHLYHINMIKKMYPDSILIAILNGHFLQRGEISIISKYDKANIALLNGVDIVVSLPTIFGVQSADTFANAALKILNYLGVNKIVFGSECNDVKKLQKLANKMVNNNENKKIKEYLDMGYNYPTALSKVLNENFEYLPNDLLGICYIKSIIQNNYNITPVTIQRTNNYLDLTSNDDIISASNIRNKILNNEKIDKYIPKNITKYLKKVDNELYFNLLKIQIINHDISNILDVDTNMFNLLKKVINNVNSTGELINKLKSKKYTYNRINRMLVHILLSVTKEDAKCEIDYLNIIGFNQKGKKYLNSIKKDLNISLKTNIKSKCYYYEIKAALIYDMLTKSNEYKKELSNKPIIL